MLNKNEKPAVKPEKSQNDGHLQHGIHVFGIGVFDHDHLTDSIYWSSEQRLIFGWGQDEPVALSMFLEQVYPEDREQVAAAVQIANNPSGNGEFDVDCRIFRRDGAIRWLSIRSQTYFGEKNGRSFPVRTIGAALDITERKTIEEALRVREEQLARSQELAHLGSWELDLVTNRLTWSDEIFRIFEIDPKKFGASYEAFLNAIHPDDRELINKAYTTSVEEHNRYSIVHRLLMSDGRVKYVHEIGETFYDHEGKPLRSVGTVQDITDRKKLEDDLLKAQKLESLGVLAGGIAHDFNNIITGILGNVSLAKTRVDPKDWLFSRLNEAEKASIRAAGLAKQLLTFAKGGIQVKEPVSLQEMLENIVHFALTGSNVRSHISIQKGLWAVLADEGQIGQVIHNLVINAQQAMPEGGTIEVKARNLAIGENQMNKQALKGASYVEITVKDAGVGIPNEILSKIFDPFFTTKKNGSGLGLAISHSIIQKHDGFITVESIAGTGTIFHIYLPGIPDAVIPQKTAGRTIQRGSGRILLVDDEESVLNVAGEILQYLGYTADLAPNGELAIQKFKDSIGSNQPFDVVITDLTMPGEMGGKEILKKLREIDPQVKVIASSGYSSKSASADFKTSGFSGFIQKPYQTIEMSEILHRVNNKNK
jgi:PAS domain S-box-containing protein